jgi:amidase
MGARIESLDAAGAGDLAAALAAGTLSALEACQAAIDRIETRDGPINAVVVRDFDRALGAAKAADQALGRGERRPLLGVPMTVKEAFNVAGLPTTWGSAEFKDWIAPADATAVVRLKHAGAVILGKTNIPPFLGDWQSDNPVYGRTHHPLDGALTPGGSSGGGAAALASGMVPLEFGSDIGGSIRVPAAFCGVYGHKPSYGLVPSRGHAPPGVDGVSPPLNVVGPLARSVSDLVLALDVTAGPAEDESVGYRLALPPARHAKTSDFRILVLDQHPACKTAGDIREAIGALARRLEAEGAKVAYSSDRLPDLRAAHGLYLTVLFTAITRGAPDQPNPMNAHAWMDALDGQLAYRRAWGALFETVDVVIAPCIGVTAFPHQTAPFFERVFEIDGETTPYGDQVAWPGMTTLANLPATAVPIGKTKAGLPIGVQIIGPYLEDRTPLALAALIEGMGF